MSKLLRALRDKYLPALLAVILITCAYSSNAQVYQVYPQHGGEWKRLVADSTLGIPYGPTRSLRGGVNGASIFFQTSDTSLNIWTGSQWISYHGASNVYVDTVYSRGDSVFYKKSGTEVFIYKAAGTGTVTSVAPGVGMAPGTITSSGTLNVDTSKMATKRAVDKARDSVQANVNTKLNITDTTNKWITGIFRRSDSVFVNKGGSWTFAYKDSTGGGSSTPDTLKVRWPLYSLQGSGGAADTLVFNKFTGADSGYMTPAKWAEKVNVTDTSNKWLTGMFRRSDSVFVNKGGSWIFAYRDSVGAGSSYTFAQSIVNSSGTVTLVNDSASLVNKRVFAYDGTSKGWKPALMADSTGIKNGSLFYWNGTNVVPIAPGTSSQILHGGTTPQFKDTTAVTGGGGSPNTSVGSGFRVAINGTNNIKSLTGGIDMLLDSTTSNQVNISADTTTGTTKLATQGYVTRSRPGLDVVTSIKDSTSYRFVTSDTAKAQDLQAHRRNIVGDAVASGKAMTIYGTSIADVNPPTNVTVAQSYATLVPQALGFNPINRAKAGTTTMQYSAGDSSVENKIYTIPTFSAAHGLLLLDAPGLNDFYVPFGHAFDTVALKAMLNKWLDTAHTARGWPYDSIVFVSAPYTTSTQYPHAHDANRAARTVCESRGVWFIDMETFMQSKSGYFTAGDTIHSNATGHQFYTANILKTLYKLSKVGMLNVKGGGQIDDSLYVKNLLRIGDFTPTYSPSSYKAIIGGDLDVFGIIRNGNQTSDLHSGKVQIETSIGVPAFSTKDGSGTADLYVPYLQFNNSGSVVKYGYSSIDINAVSGYFTLVGGSGVKVAEFGPNTGVILNGSNYTAGSLQTKGSGSSYLIFTDPRAAIDRVGIRDSVPQQTFSVRGSGFFLDSLIAAGKFKLSGIPQAAGSKLLHWDPSTNMVSWADSTAAGGSGEVNTASNLGVTTYGLFKSKVGVDLQFKSLTSTAPVVLTSNTNDVQIGLDTAAGKWRSENYYNTKFLSAIDTGNISSFAAKVRSLHTVSSPVVYNSATGLISLDTAAGKWRSENYYNTKFLSSVDTTNISSFASKVRSLFTVSAPVVYNSATGLLSLDTATGKWRSENYYNTKFISSVAGTTNRITVTGTTAPVIDISASYVGQSSITTLGTVTSGGLGTGATLGGVTPALGSDATGDLYYRNSGGVLTRLPIGTSKQVLHGGTIPVWLDTTATGGASYTFVKSVVNSGGNVSLVGDSTTLNGPPYVYGSQNGIRTFYKAITTNLTSPAQGDVITYKALDTTLVNTTKPAFLLYNNYRADTVVTTDATQTTIATIATAGSAFYSKGTLEITLDASSTTAGISGSRIYRFVNNAGTITITDRVDIGSDDLATLTTASWTVVVSGNNLLIKVTGQSAQTLTWVALSKIHWSQTGL